MRTSKADALEFAGRCAKAKNARHVVEFGTVSCFDGCGSSLYVDVRCQLCHVCGTVAVDEAGIRWDS